MDHAAGDLRRGPLATLQGFVRKPRRRADGCELCAALLELEHPHLLDLEKRRVLCSCDACAILFDGHSAQRYRRIPRSIQRLEDFQMEDQEWESLLIPINLAFFVHSSLAGRTVANYPSPGGVMESSLELEYWNAIVARNPVLKKFEPDVEALLVNRIASPAEYYRAPIDRCFQLAGIIRTEWRGLSGGTNVWEEIDGFFQRLSEASGGQRA